MAAGVAQGAAAGVVSLRDEKRGTLVARRVTLGTSFWQRFRGLMGRASLAPDEGLFLPVNSIHMLFMRFAIDALFVGPADAAGRRSVVALKPGVPAWRGLVLPVRGADGVIELPVGTLARCGLQPGEIVVVEPGVGLDTAAS